MRRTTTILSFLIAAAVGACGAPESSTGTTASPQVIITGLLPAPGFVEPLMGPCHGRPQLMCLELTVVGPPRHHDLVVRVGDAVLARRTFEPEHWGEPQEVELAVDGAAQITVAEEPARDGDGAAR
jgi:hypothetical protein